MKIKITGIGSYIPEMKVANTDFDKHVFLNQDGSPFAYPNEVVIEKFKSITGIDKRRYALPDQCTSDFWFSYYCGYSSNAHRCISDLGCLHRHSRIKTSE